MVDSRKIVARFIGEVERAMNTLTDAVNADEGYLYGWHDNLACAAVDEGVDRATANRIAERFLYNLFEVHSKSPEDRLAADESLPFPSDQDFAIDAARHLGVGINLPSPGQSFSWDDNDSLADAITKSASLKVFAKYVEKRTVPKANGKGTTEIRVYSPRQIALRKSKKSKRLQKLSGKIDKMMSEIKKDLTSSDTKIARVALAISLIDQTYERVGNETSAAGENSDTDKTPHLGVTGWGRDNITFKGSKATIKYRGKSSVDHVKVVEDAATVKALKKAYDECKGDDLDCIFHWDGGKVTAKDVNEKLRSYGDLTAKDLRGHHANALMKEELKKVRKGELPTDKKERAKKLKDEWKKALETTAAEIQHEPATLQGQYLVDSMKESYLKDGTIIDRLDS